MTDEETKAPDEEKPESKTFTQADIDRIVQREKAAVLASEKRKREELEAQLKAQGDTSKVYESTVEELVKEMSKDIPAPMLKLLDKLTPVDKLKFLQDPENGIVFEKKEFPLSKKKVTATTQEFKPVEPDKIF